MTSATDFCGRDSAGFFSILLEAANIELALPLDVIFVRVGLAPINMEIRAIVSRLGQGTVLDSPPQAETPASVPTRPLLLAYDDSNGLAASQDNYLYRNFPALISTSYFTDALSRHPITGSLWKCSTTKQNHKLRIQRCIGVEVRLANFCPGGSSLPSQSSDGIFEGFKFLLAVIS